MKSNPGTGTDSAGTLTSIQQKLAAKAADGSDSKKQEAPLNLPDKEDEHIVRLMEDAEIGFGIGHDNQTLAITAGHVAPMVKPQTMDREGKVPPPIPCIHLPSGCHTA